MLDAMTTGRGGGGDENNWDGVDGGGVCHGNCRNCAHKRLMAVDLLLVPLLEEFVLGVMFATRNNALSMLQSIEAGQTIEVHYLNGYVLSMGPRGTGSSARGTMICANLWRS